MTLAEGLEPEKVRAVASGLLGNGEKVEGLRQSGTAMLGVLEGVWEGPDLEHFSRSWSETAPQLAGMAAALREASEQLYRQADQQEDASAGSSAGGKPPKPVSDDRPWWEEAWDGVVDFGRGILDFGQGVIDTVADGVGWVLDRIGDGLELVGEGLVWLGGKVVDGLSWLGGKILDGLSWVGGKIVDLVDALVRRIVAAAAAAERLVLAIRDASVSLALDILNGEFPSLSEIVAEVAIIAGSSAGILANLFTGEDQHLFDDGRGQVSGVTELSATDAVNGHPPITAPESLADIMRGTSDAYENDANVRITTITRPDGSTAYIVNTPGTQTWSPGTTDNPFDLMGNLGGIQGDSTAATQAVQAAMEEAGIPPGAPVMLVGHSQGGITNNALLSDPAFTEQYNVTHSVTYGSPVETLEVDPSVQQLNLAHESDIVPQLDLENFPFPSEAGDATNIVFEDPPSGSAHDHGAYAQSVEGSNDPDLQAYMGGLDDFIVEDGDGSQVSGVDIEVERVHD